MGCNRSVVNSLAKYLGEGTSQRAANASSLLFFVFAVSSGVRGSGRVLAGFGFGAVFGVNSLVLCFEEIVEFPDVLVEFLRVFLNLDLLAQPH